MVGNRKFLNKFSIYATGNISSKLIMFLLYPVLTFYLLPDELGVFDLYFSIIIWVGGAAMLNIRDGVFRFVISDDRVAFISIITLFVKIALYNALLLFLIALFCYLFKIDIAFNPFLLAVFFLAFNFYEVYQQIIRAAGRTKLYVIGNIISAASVAVVAITLLQTTDLKANSLIIAYTISKILAFAITEKIYPALKIALRGNKDGLYNKSIAKKALKYSLLLFPANLATSGIENWGRLFIFYYIGEYYNGVYAVVIKFSAIFYIITVIYRQTWQECALRDYNSVDKNAYFSRFFNYLLLFLSVSAVCFAIGIALFYPILMSEAYYESVQYIFPQVLSIIFMSLSSFLGVGYECSYQVKRAMYSAVLASLVSFLLNYLLISNVGLMGCIIANICAGLSLFIYRLIDTRRYFKISINKYGVLGIVITLIAALVWSIYYGF